MMEHVHKALRPLRQRISMLAGRAIVRMIEDAGDMQLVQMGALADETLDQVEHAQPYGLAYRAKAGAEAIVLSLGGIRGRAVVINIGDRRFRMKGLAEGEVALYDDQGQVVHLKRDGIYVTTSGKAVVTAAHCNLISPDVNLGGEGGKKVVLDGDPVAGGVVHASSTKVKAI